jgi:hypothetical protein
VFFVRKNAIFARFLPMAGNFPQYRNEKQFKALVFSLVLSMAGSWQGSPMEV